MKTINLIGLLFFSIGTYTNAFAETKNFEGLSFYLGGSTVSTTLKHEYRDFDGTINGEGKTTFSGDFGADYGLNLSENSLVLIGITYGLGKTTAYESWGGMNRTVNLRDRWSIYAAPGVTFGEKALLYAKLAYVSVRIQRSTLGFQGDEDTVHPGIGYGVGGRFLLKENVFLNVEFMQNRYSDKRYSPTGLNVDDSAITTSGTIAFGYTF